MTAVGVHVDSAEGAGSAKSLIGARVGARCDYLELVEGLTERGSDVNADLVELWRRIAFSIALNNIDDHMRNHALLRARRGWTLSPIFDVNPDPRAGVPRVSSIAGATGADECRRALFDSAARFGLEPADAEHFWAELLEVVAQWRDTAFRNGISGAAQEQFSPALDRWSA